MKVGGSGAVLLLVTVWLVGCGDDVFLSTPIGGDGEPSAVSRGRVTGVGSIEVNGVTFNTEQAELQFEEITRTAPADLVPGMVVTVRGEVSEAAGTAEVVIFEDDVQGIVSSDPFQGAFTVLGQLVVADERTVFVGAEPAGIEGLAGGNVVEVSGFREADGTLRATFIAKQTDLASPGSVLEVTGPINVIDSNSFFMGSLTVIADTRTLVDGDVVEVEGFPNNLVGNIFTAQGITRLDPGLGVQQADSASIEGIVTSVLSDAEFLVGTQPVRLALGAAQFDGGGTADIVADTWLRLHGGLTDSVLVASRVEFLDPIVIEGDVDSDGADQVTFRGLDIPVTIVDNQTRFDATGIFSSVFDRFSDILNGDHLRVRGRLANGGIVASRVSLLDPLVQDVRLQGPATVAPPLVAILGVSIDTTALALRNEQGQALESGAFFDALAADPSALVSALGTWNGFTVTWASLVLDQ